jgi:hypothetical protein
MSVMTDASQNASSSRMLAVYRYLVTLKGNKEDRQTLESLLSPTALLRTGDENATSRGMVRGTINEALKMRFLTEFEETKEIGLHPDLPPAVLEQETGEALLPFTLARLMLTTENSANENLALVIAWYLAQNSYSAPGTWNQFEAKWKEQVGGSLFSMNDARYSQFVDWICFLGFAWRHSLQRERVITPDPTRYLRNAVSHIFRQDRNDVLIMKDFMDRLSILCPVFEGGAFRTRIEAETRVQPLDSNRISSVTSLGLLRLQDERVVELFKLSDADVFILPDGERIHRYSHIRFLDGNSKGH